MRAAIVLVCLCACVLLPLACATNGQKKSSADHFVPEEEPVSKAEHAELVNKHAELMNKHAELMMEKQELVRNYTKLEAKHHELTSIFSEFSHYKGEPRSGSRQLLGNRRRRRRGVVATFSNLVASSAPAPTPQCPSSTNDAGTTYNVVTFTVGNILSPTEIYGYTDGGSTKIEYVLDLDTVQFNADTTVQQCVNNPSAAGVTSAFNCKVASVGYLGGLPNTWHSMEYNAEGNIGCKVERKCTFTWASGNTWCKPSVQCEVKGLAGSNVGTCGVFNL